MQVRELSGVVAVAAGTLHLLAVLSDGTLWAWGSNEYGQRGDGSTAWLSSPVRVQGLSGVVATAAGGGHVLAVRSDGTLWSWGYNPYGQLGNGAPVYATTAIRSLLY
nr:hypothetical protein [Archangium violaceum]